MTDLVAVAIATAAGPTIASVASLIISLRNSGKANKIVRTTETIEKQAESIHKLADGNLSAVKAELALANEKIAANLGVVTTDLASANAQIAKLMEIVGRLSKDVTAQNGAAHKP